MASSSDQVVALPPPLGQISNLINPYSFAKWDIVCVVVCLTVTTIVLLLRSYVRLWIKRQWVLEDHMCCLSWALLASFCALSTVVMKDHGGVHEWDLTKAEAPVIIRMYNIASIVYGPAICCTKISILLLYRRVFSPQKKSHFDRAIRIFIVILLLFYITNTFLKIFQCTPRRRIWDKRVPGTCLNLGDVLTASGAFNTITDILIFLIPVKISWNLNTSAKRKVAVVLLFTFGFLAPVFSTVGLVVRIRTINSRDVTYVQPEIILWGAAEITTGLICVCASPLAALAHPPRNRGRKTYFNVISGESRRNDGSRRTRPEICEQHDLFTSSDVELQYSGAAPGFTLPTPLVTTDISSGYDVHERMAEQRRFESVGLEDVANKAGDGSGTIGVTTTIRLKQYYL